MLRWLRTPKAQLLVIFAGLLLVAALGAGTAQLLGAGQVFLLVGLLCANAVLAVVRFVRRRDSASLVTSAVSS